MARAILALRRGIAARLLPGLVGIMVFLGVVALAAAFVASQAVATWSRNIDAGLTATLPESAGPKAEDVVAMLRQTPGVAQARRLSAAETAGLLEPWLGSDAAAGDLPLPVLLDIRIDPAVAVDRLALAAKIDRLAPGARLDAHRDWIEDLVRLGRAVQWLAFGAAGLVMAAVAAVVVVAVRAGLAVEHDTVELLHLIGARDGFIAGEFEGLVSRLSLLGALAGAVLALAAILGLRASADAMGMPALPRLELTLTAWAAIVAFALAAVLLARIAARATVFAVLRRMA